MNSSCRLCQWRSDDAQPDGSRVKLTPNSSAPAHLPVSAAGLSQPAHEMPRDNPNPPPPAPLPDRVPEASALCLACFLSRQQPTPEPNDAIGRWAARGLVGVRSVTRGVWP